MNNKIEHIVTEKATYPIVFNINVMEEIQEAYGSLSAWGGIVENKDGGEPRVRDLKIGLKFMINEGLDIENEEKGEKRPMLTSKQVGRVIDEVGFSKITEVIQKITVSSTNTGDNEGKNE